MILAVVNRLLSRLVPDELWALADPLIPVFEPRPQGGGTAPVDARAVFTAIVYVLTSGVRMARSAAVIRGAVPDRTPPLRPVDQGRAAATVAPRALGRTRQPGPPRPEPRVRRWCLRAGEREDL
jgi:transposase